MIKQKKQVPKAYYRGRDIAELTREELEDAYAHVTNYAIAMRYTPTHLSPPLREALRKGDWDYDRVAGFPALMFNGSPVVMDSPDLLKEIPDVHTRAYVVPKDLWLEYELVAQRLYDYRPRQ